jgi:hypothetical protein
MEVAKKRMLIFDIISKFSSGNPITFANLLHNDNRDDGCEICETERDTFKNEAKIRIFVSYERRVEEVGPSRRPRAGSSEIQYYD